MKIKPVFAGIAILGALLLILSLNTVGKIWGANPRSILAVNKNQPQAAQILPKRSPLFLSFLVKPEKLGLFTQLAAKTSDRAEISRRLDKIKQQLQQNWLLDYERDVQPWLDREMTLAVTNLDLDDQPDNGLQTGYALALAIQDRDLAKTSLDAFWQRLAVGGVDVGFEQYQGLSILSTGFENNSPAIAQTVVDGFVLFANDKRVLHQIIDTAKSTDNAIASLDSYKNSLASLNNRNNEKGKFGVVYANFAELGADFPSENLLVSLNLDKSGLRLKTAIGVKQNIQNSNLNSIQPFSKSIANIIPHAGSVAIGNNLSQTLQTLEKMLMPSWQNSLTNILAPIPLDSRVLSWVQSDYAIALFPKENPPKTNSGSNWLLVAKVQDPDATNTAIAELDQLYRAKLTVGEINLNQQPITIWTNLSAASNVNYAGVAGNIVVAHTQTKEYVYFSNSLSVLQSAISLNKRDAIASSKDFQAAIARLPKDQSTYVYLDQNFIKQNYNKFTFSSIAQILQLDDLLLFPIGKYLERVGIAVDNNQSHVQNGEIFLSLVH
ncbi:DUF3352 domain-containing protein [Pseudanabaena biceps]|nr:DUF3352 domain-containing protein [Pseudanabaena biceps]